MLKDRRHPGLLQSLSARLFLWLFGVIIVAFAAYAFVNVRSTSGQWEKHIHETAQRFSNLIQHSTHNGMLHNQREDVYQTIRMISRDPGVEAVRIYNKDGVIMFSGRDSEIGRRVDLKGEACVSCHGSDVPLASVPAGNRTRIFRKPDDTRVLGLINPIENAPECYEAACHAHPEEQSILGVLDVTMSMAESDARLAKTERDAVIAAVLTALLAAIFSAVFIVRLVRRPVHRLIDAAEKVASGDLDTEIALGSGDEIGLLAAAFDRMTGDLRQARRELTDWSDRLEAKLEEKSTELTQTQRQIAHMDKMASLGKLAATVAHELNNPLAGILNYAKLVDRTIRESDAPIPERDEVERYLELIREEANRSGVIVKNLLLFARRSGVDFATNHLNAVLERSVMLVRHHLEIASIQPDVELLPGDDRLLCDGDQIQQAIVALLVNAVEAMPDGGRLRLAAEHAGDAVRLTIADTGVGIPKDDLSRIFEPFFSLKERGNRSGLGLAVVYGIVQRHGGRIEVESDVGRGTTFRIVLPRRPQLNEHATVGAIPRESEVQDAHR